MKAQSGLVGETLGGFIAGAFAIWEGFANLSNPWIWIVFVVGIGLLFGGMVGLWRLLRR